MKRWIATVLLLFVWLYCSPMLAAPVAFYNSYAGNYDFEVTGGSLRTSDTAGQTCNVVNSDSASLSGIPGTASIVVAFLYWAGSGSTSDLSVTFESTTTNASRSFTESDSGRDWFAGFADVTSIVQNKAGGPNGTYTFADLTVDTGGAHCTVSTVLSGWGLVVIYSDAAEPLRVINIFDGLQNFWGTSVTLTPNNFVIPSTGIDGKFGVLTWEGDAGNSGQRNGLFEELQADGNSLTDALNPAQNQYNSTINTLGVTTSWGVDFDTYDISPYLSAGDTSISTVYSTGQDRVLLTMEIVSVTNTPVVDLAISKSHVGDFIAGQQGVYTISVSNNGPNNETNTITVSDTLPAGLTYVSATSTDTNWNCGAVGQVVTCTHPGPLTNGASLADITLTVNAGLAAAPSVTNTATVSSSTFDNIAANDSSSDLTNVLVPDLSTSTKDVVDLNGGEADVGDVLRYTITILETGGAPATGVSVSDTIDSLLTSFSVVSIPSGATDNSTPGTGPLDVSGISVTANGSATIVFDATISGSANPSDLINNTATINEPLTGTNTGAVAPTVTVSPSQIPTTGIKNLYPYFAEAPSPDTDTLQRIVPTSSTRSNTMDGNGSSFALTMSPSTQANLELGSGNIQIPMCIRRVGGAAAQGRNVTLTLDYFAAGAGGSNGVIGSDVQTGILTGAGWQVFIFNVNLAADTILNPNTALRMTVTNNSPATNRRIRVRSLTGNANCGTTFVSRIELNANTVINVDSVDVYDAAYPATTAKGSYQPGETVFIRAVVSDPFGSFDITSANIEILDGGGTPVLASTAMTQVADSGADTKTYEYQYTIPSGNTDGAWVARVTANEGTEGNISDLGIGTFFAGLPGLSILKISTTISDPINGGPSNNPKAIPGAIVEYQIGISNSGVGPADSDSVVITDPIAADVQLFLGSPADPVQFTNGSVSSGLSFSFTTLSDTGDDVDFSNNGGSTFIEPVVDGLGFDITVPPINYIRINPKGRLNGSVGSGDPSFTLQFRVRKR